MVPQPEHADHGLAGSGQGIISEAQQQIVSARHAGQISSVVVNTGPLVINVSGRVGRRSEAAFLWDSAPQPLMWAADSDAALMRTAGTASVSGGEVSLSELRTLIFEYVCHLIGTTALRVGHGSFWDPGEASFYLLSWFGRNQDNRLPSP